jgi:membrane protease YdiL (CAAX protease family)
MNGWPDEEASPPTEETPFALAAHDIPLARPVTPPKPTSVCGRDLLIGVPIAWGCDLVLIAGAAIAAILVTLLAADALDSIEQNPPILPLLVGQLFAGIAAAVVAWYFVCRKYGKTFVEGFSLRPTSWRAQIGCLLLGAVSAILIGLAPGEDTGDSMLADLVQAPYGLLAISILAVILPPFEEMYYRGFIFPALRKKLGGGAAIVIVASWFGLIHLPQLFPDLLAVLAVASMGLIWTVLRHVSDSLWPPIITHWTYNVTLVIISTLGQATE